MNYTVKSAIAKADSAARFAITKAETAFVVAPAPAKFPAAKSSPGKLIATLALAETSGFDPVPVIRGIRNEAARNLKAARDHLKAASDVSSFLSLAALALRNRDEIPPAPANVPDSVIAALKSVRRYADAGILNASELADVLDDAAATANRELAKASADFRRFESTMSVMTTKRSADVAEAYGKTAMAEGLRKKAHARTIAHRIRVNAHRKFLAGARKNV
jgi:predicted ATPase